MAAVAGETGGAEAAHLAVGADDGAGGAVEARRRRARVRGGQLAHRSVVTGAATARETDAAAGRRRAHAAVEARGRRAHVARGSVAVTTAAGGGAAVGAESRAAETGAAAARNVRRRDRYKKKEAFNVNGSSFFDNGNKKTQYRFLNKFFNSY